MKKSYLQDEDKAPSVGAGLVKRGLLAMILVFQLPTIVLFLARLRLVTARLLWNHFKHAILVVFIEAGAGETSIHM